MASDSFNNDSENINKVPEGFSGRYRPPLVSIPSNVSNTVGESGRPVALLSNYFRLNVPGDEIQVFQYRVTFDPDRIGSIERRALLMKHKKMFGEAFVYDARSDLKMLKKLEESVSVTSIRKTDETEIRITITPVGVLGWDDAKMIPLYTMQMRRNFRHILYVLIGSTVFNNASRFFDPSAINEIPEHRVQLWSGLLTKINAHDAGILMVCDTVFRVVRTETVYEMLRNVLQLGADNFHVNASRKIGSRVVMTTYNNKTYRVCNIAFDKSPKSVFGTKNGKISIENYYKEKYGITIRDLQQPLIVAERNVPDREKGFTQPALLVPELCRVTHLPECLSANFSLKQKIDKITNEDPNCVIQNLQSFIRSVNDNSKVKMEMGTWGLSFDDKLMEVRGRQLNEEQIFLQTPQKYSQETGNFQNQILGQKMKEPKDFVNWCVIAMESDQENTNEFVDVLRDACTPMGIMVKNPKIRIISNDDTSSFIEVCRTVPQELELVVIIVPDNNKERYNAIKKIFCVERGIASQIIISSSISKKETLVSTCTKVGIEMSVKLGAEVWYLEIPPKDLMVVGYDSYGDRKEYKNAVGGFVCSLNQTLTQWFSKVDFHFMWKDLSSKFAANFVEGLKRYQEINEKFPLNVVVYRVSDLENEIRHIFEFELKMIKNEIRKINSETKLTFVIVTKEVSTRFFLKRGDGYTNPIPGTVVDTTVTREEQYDFYLISKCVAQGTVSPTLYTIFGDESEWKPSHHQQLAYKLCHLYYNCPGTISIPAPCQYAHDLAFLTFNSLNCEANVSLSDKLFYL